MAVEQAAADGRIRMAWESHRGLTAALKEYLADLEADLEDRVQRRRRLLEDHRQLLAPDRAHLLGTEREQVAALERDRAGFDPIIQVLRPVSPLAWLVSVAAFLPLSAATRPRRSAT